VLTKAVKEATSVEEESASLAIQVVAVACGGSGVVQNVPIILAAEHY
jgi:hypothetical protein